ncbi:hypothetical protein BJX64DRAFT_288578 [Aspergillus heterothallicus]
MAEAFIVNVGGGVGRTAHILILRPLTWLALAFPCPSLHLHFYLQALNRSPSTHPNNYPANASSLCCTGGFALQSLPAYPRLPCVVQGRAAVVQRAEAEICPREAPQILVQTVCDRVTDSHDWSDDYCVRMLSPIRVFMDGADLAHPHLRPGYEHDIWLAVWRLRLLLRLYRRTTATASVIAGMERTPARFAEIVQRAGLKVIKIWTCRSMVGMVEIGL